jgi:hypothetical protein
MDLGIRGSRAGQIAVMGMMSPGLPELRLVQRSRKIMIIQQQVLVQVKGIHLLDQPTWRIS